MLRSNNIRTFSYLVFWSLWGWWPCSSYNLWPKRIIRSSPSIVLRTSSSLIFIKMSYKSYLLISWFWIDRRSFPLLSGGTTPYTQIVSSSHPTTMWLLQCRKTMEEKIFWTTFKSTKCCALKKKIEINHINDLAKSITLD